MSISNRYCKIEEKRILQFFWVRQILHLEILKITLKCSICWSWSMKFLEFSTYVTPFCKNYRVVVGDALKKLATFSLKSISNFLLIKELKWRQSRTTWWHSWHAVQANKNSTPTLSDDIKTESTIYTYENGIIAAGFAVFIGSHVGSLDQMLNLFMFGM